MRFISDEQFIAGEISMNGFDRVHTPARNYFYWVYRNCFPFEIYKILKIYHRVATSVCKSTPKKIRFMSTLRQTQRPLLRLSSMSWRNCHNCVAECRTITIARRSNYQNVRTHRRVVTGYVVWRNCHNCAIYHRQSQRGSVCMRL
jgi:hypothetical protein